MENSLCLEKSGNLGNLDFLMKKKSRNFKKQHGKLKTGFGNQKKKKKKKKKIMNIRFHCISHAQS